MPNPSSTAQLEIAVADAPTQQELADLLCESTRNAHQLACLLEDPANRFINGVGNFISIVSINFGDHKWATAIIREDGCQSPTRISREGTLLLQTGATHVPKPHGSSTGYGIEYLYVPWFQHMGEHRNRHNASWIQMLSEANIQIKGAITLINTQ